MRSHTWPRPLCIVWIEVGQQGALSLSRAELPWLIHFQVKANKENEGNLTSLLIARLGIVYPFQNADCLVQ